MVPDIQKYDTNIPGEIALYWLHRDLFPFEKMLETFEVAINTYEETYFENAQRADANGDEEKSNEQMIQAIEFRTTVRPQAYSSWVLLLYSFLEEGFNTLCRAYQNKNSYTISYLEVKGKGLERAVTYLSKVCGVKGIKQHKLWRKIVFLRNLRNRLVHDAGRVKKEESFAKVAEEFNCYINDYGMIEVDYDLASDLYRSVIEFAGEIFRYSPSKV